MAAKTALETDELALSKKYPHIIKGTIRDVSNGKGKFHHKRSVEIKCTFKGCKETRRVATSDLAQVKFCEQHTRMERLRRRRAARLVKVEV